MKIPKYYHTDFSKSSRQSTSSQSDPLLGVGDIKSEPIDYDENSSAVEYNDQHDQYAEHSTASKPMNPLIVTSSSPADKGEMKFKKIKLTKPVIMEVHTVEEPKASAGGIEVIKIKLQKSRKASDISSNMGNTTIVSTEGIIADEPDNEKSVYEESLLSKSSARHESEIEELGSEASQLEDGEEPPALSKESTMAATPIKEVYKYSADGPPTLAKEVGLRNPIEIDDTLQTSGQTMINDASEEEDDRPLVEYIPTLYNSVEDIEEPKINTLRIHEVYSEADNIASSTQEEIVYNNSINEMEDSDQNCQIQIIETHSVSQEADEMQCDEQIMTTSLTHLKNEVTGAADTINTDIPPDIE